MNSLENSCVAISGDLGVITREAAVRLIHESGGSHSISIGKGTTHMILGRNPSQHDLSKAEMNNVRIIWRNQFLAMVGLTL